MQGGSAVALQVQEHRATDNANLPLVFARIAGYAHYGHWRSWYVFCFDLFVARGHCAGSGRFKSRSEPLWPTGHLLGTQGERQGHDLDHALITRIGENPRHLAIVFRGQRRLERIASRHDPLGIISLNHVGQ